MDGAVAQLVIRIKSGNDPPSLASVAPRWVSTPLVVQSRRREGSAARAKGQQPLIASPFLLISLIRDSWPLKWSPG
jgi:hypothetical protein